MKKIDRTTIRGKRLDSDCYLATISKEKHEDIELCFCWGLRHDDYIICEKCQKCKAFVDNIKEYFKTNFNVDLIG